MSNRIVLNKVSYHGEGAIQEIPAELKAHSKKKVLVVTDPDLIKFEVSKKVTDILDAENIAYEVFSDIKANPTIDNVKDGVQAFYCSLKYRNG